MKKLISGAETLGLSLNPEQLEKFEVYYRELVEWNKRANLTSITDYEEAQTRHFLDSLTVLTGLPAAHPPEIIDVGSGAGLPGIPLSIVLPETRVVLLEATAKKADFLRHITSKLELDNVEVLRGRAEEAAHDESYRESFSMAVSRALAPLNVLAELTLPFCATGGRLIAQKKGDISEEIEQASRAVSILGGKIDEVLDVNLDEFDDGRRLVIIDKVGVTPQKYPRRSGMPAKKPIL